MPCGVHLFVIARQNLLKLVFSIGLFNKVTLKFLVSYRMQRGFYALITYTSMYKRDLCQFFTGVTGYYSASKTGCRFSCSLHC